jgi:Zn-dependent protease
MARFFGIGTRDITLYPIGGVARLESTGARPHEEICIALAGPLVNLVIVLLLSPFVAFVLAAGMLRSPATALVGSGGPLALGAAYLFTLWLGNGVLLVFNLVPAFPMDGGRVLRGLLTLPLGLVRATEIAAVVGLLASAGLAVLGVLVGNPVLVVVAIAVAILGQFEAQAVRQHKARRRLEALPVLDVVLPAEPAHPRLADFTGLFWDRDRCVWVRWVNGRPVDVC